MNGETTAYLNSCPYTCSTIDSTCRQNKLTYTNATQTRHRCGFEMYAYLPGTYAVALATHRICGHHCVSGGGGVYTVGGGGEEGFEVAAGNHGIASHQVHQWQALRCSSGDVSSIYTSACECMLRLDCSVRVCTYMYTCIDMPLFIHLYICTYTCIYDVYTFNMYITYTPVGWRMFQATVPGWPCFFLPVFSDHILLLPIGTTLFSCHYYNAEFPS